MLLLRTRSMVIFAIVIMTTLPFTGAQFASAAVGQAVSSRPENAVTSADDERVLRLEWSRSFYNHSWAELDSLADRLRSQRLRFQGGGWQLHVLYCIVSTGCSRIKTDAVWEKRIAALQDWIRYAPSSPTPRIALADAYQEFAWQARGGGYTDSVTQQGWKLFDERAQKAREILEESKEIGRSDPEWYDAMLHVAIDQGWSRAQVEALVDEALSKEPGYFYVVREGMEYFLPKWYGTPGDAEQFVDAVANKIGGAEGDATYFFVAETLLVNEDHCFDCSPPAMSWKRIRQGYAAIRRLPRHKQLRA